MVSAPFNILVLDDEEDVLEYWQDLLEDLFADEMNIKTTASPEEALNILMNENIHILMTDHNMPSMNGDAVLRAVVAMNKNIQVIVVTGFAEEELVKDCLGAGAVAVIEKPYESEALKEVIGLCIANLNQ